MGYRRLPEGEFSRIFGDPEQAEAYICDLGGGLDLDTLISLADNPDALKEKGIDILAALEERERDPRRVDLEKEWHLLHFLLTGDASMKVGHRPDNPLYNVVMGGTKPWWKPDMDRLGFCARPT